METIFKIPYMYDIRQGVNTMESKILTEIVTALEKAKEEGQPVDELMEAVQNGAELEAWFEPQVNGKCELKIAIRND